MSKALSLKTISRLVASGGFLLLAGCLVSKEPMLSASNGAATPLAIGRYDACNGETGSKKAPECNPIDVSVSGDGLYSFSLPEEESVSVRFGELDGGGYAVQISDNDGYEYYWGSQNGDVFKLVMIWCADLSQDVVDALTGSGAMTADEKRQTCTANTPDAVFEAARAYRDGKTNAK
ncbi:MAG: hypothetical protein R3C60_13115 [Parvularculaceae bacterium]